LFHDYEVAVIGAGPVGATALALLGNAGIRAVAFDREPSHWTTARAVHFDGETLRTLQSIGLGDRAIAMCRPMTNVMMENEAHEVLFDIPTGGMGAQAWPDDVMFHQPEMEALLREEIASLPSVEARLGTTVTHVEQMADGVRCDLELADGSTDSVTARWAIACDGANSGVRRQLGVDTANLGSDDPWLVVDGLLHDSPGMASDMAFLGHHSRPALWARLTGARVRMEFKVMPGDEPEEIVTPKAIERLSHGLLPVDHFEPDRVAIYTFRGRLAEQFRVGNVFLAGDAAHQAPPLFGQGLCAGMRDVANLTWKLDLVSKGLAPESLLDTYESERRPHARYWVEQAATMAKLVQTTDPAVAAGRDAHIRQHPEDSVPPVPRLGPGLHAGADHGGGALSPQPFIGDARLDDVVGTRFLVATTPELLESLSTDRREALNSDSRVVLLTERTQVDDLLASCGAHAVVVRPDRYVLGAADNSDVLEQLLALLPALPLAAAAQTA
jgi:3-(3-hydroxy-phenyl)propionate hydroxylase